MARDPMVEVELVDASGAAGRDGGAGRSDERAGGSDGAGTGRADQAREAPVGAVGVVPEGGGTGDGTRVRRPSARSRWYVTAGVLAVVGALGVTQAVLDARERAQYVRFAHVPGVLPPVGDGLEVVRTLPREHAVALWAGTEVDGRTLAGVFDEDGAQHAVAVDPRTGEVVWSTPLSGPDDVATHADGGGVVPCGVTSGAGPLLVCHVGTDYVPAPTPPEDRTYLNEFPLARTAEVVVLDARSGAVVHRAAADAVAAFAVLDDLAVTATTGADGRVVVQARDVRSGADAWSFTAPAGSAPPATSGDPRESLPTLLRVDGTVVLQLPGSAVRLAADGTVRARMPFPEPDGYGGTWVAPARGDRLVMQTFGPDSSRTSLLDADGAATPLPPGDPLTLAVDDGSEPGLLLLAERPWDARTDDRLVAWDVDAGRERWAVDGLGVSEAVVLDGRAVAATTDGGAVAVDLTDGSVLWRVEPTDEAERRAAHFQPGLATDGRRLLVLRNVDGSPTGERRAVVDAYAVDDGALVWSQQLPAGVDGAQALGHTLLGWSDADERTVPVLG